MVILSGNLKVQNSIETDADKHLTHFRPVWIEGGLSPKQTGSNAQSQSRGPSWVTENLSNDWFFPPTVALNGSVVCFHRTVFQAICGIFSAG